MISKEPKSVVFFFKMCYFEPVCNAGQPLAEFHEFIQTNILAPSLSVYHFHFMQLSFYAAIGTFCLRAFSVTFANQNYLE